VIKKIALFLIAIIVCSVAFAGDPAATPVTGKITAVGEGTITVTLDSETAAWVKKNAPVKFTAGVGKILDVTAEGVTPVVINMKTKKAAQMKVGDPITLQKGRPMAGC
jgi:hypothetical protein